MPSLNKGRVANVIFDDNRRYYDDILLPVHNGSFLLEGENGDGKTLLIQCLFQSIRPMMYFPRDAEKDKQNTIHALFRKNNNSTMHSAIEWKLDDGAEYDYLITGFCVRKVKKNNMDDGEDRNDIEYFNYAIMYNESVPFSIESIPLKRNENGTIIKTSYSELKTFLKKLEEQEERCLVKIFNVNKDYYKFLNSYNINQAELDLLININSTEGGSEAYYTKKYRTAYQFITNELIPRIESVEKIQQQDTYQNSQYLAESLIKIKATMEELKQKIRTKEDLEVIERCFVKLINVNEKLIQEMNTRDNTFIEISKGFNSQNLLISKTSNEIDKLTNDIEGKNNLIEEKVKDIDQNDELISKLEEDEDEYRKIIAEINTFKQILTKRAEKKVLLSKIEENREKKFLSEEIIEHINKTKEIIKENLDKLKDDKRRKEIENIYIEYLDAVRQIDIHKKDLDLRSKDIEDILLEEKDHQSKLLYLINVQVIEIEKRVSILNKNIESISNDISEINDTINSKKVEYKLTQDKIEEAKCEIDKNKNLININNEKITNNKATLGKLEKQEKDLVHNVYALNYHIENDKINTSSIGTLLGNIKETLTNNNVDMHIQYLEDFKIEIDNILSISEKEILAVREHKHILEGKSFTQELENELNPFEENIRLIEEKQFKSEKEIEDINRNKKNLNSRIGEAEEKIDDYKEAMESINHILNKYNKNNRFEVAQILESEINNLRQDIFNDKSKKEEWSEKLAGMKKNKGISIPKDTVKCQEILTKAYKSTLLGMDFYNNLNKEEKEKYLDRTTLIQYGVVLNNTEFNSLQNNKTLLEKIDDYFVPIINIDRIKEGHYIKNDIVFMNTKSKEFFINEDKIKQMINSLENNLSSLIKK